MMREPWFWRSDTITAKVISVALAPFGNLYNTVQKLKWQSAQQTLAPLPIICVGNASLGGVGKTPFAIEVQSLLNSDTRRTAFLSRGYGGHLAGPVRVCRSSHHANDVGDEPLILASHAPCFISKDRVAGALAAAEQNIDVLIMDDGFQNHHLEKTCSLLLVDNEDPAGNGLVFPAGPMREPFQQALARADAIIAVMQTANQSINKTISDNAGDKPIFTARIEPVITDLPEKAVAFCGIGKPEKFFQTLKRNNVQLKECYSFADHHIYTQAELDRMKQAASRVGAALITTEKDFVRLAETDREGIKVLPITMALNDKVGLQKILLSAIDQWHARAKPTS